MPLRLVRKLTFPPLVITGGVAIVRGVLFPGTVLARSVTEKEGIVTDQAPPAPDDSVQPAEESLQTGVLDTPGVEPRAHGVHSDSGPGGSPVDVDEASPLHSGADSASGSGDIGTGADPAGNQGG